MKKALIFIALVSVFLNYSCSNENGINIPLKPFNLIFPTNNLLCVDNEITFDWDDFVDSQNTTIRYTITIAKDRSLTDIIYSATLINQTEITHILEKETAYYWQVVATDISNNKTENSNVYAFYTKGEGVLNYAPFGSKLISPANNSQIITSGTTDLTWLGSDIDAGDTLTYQLYFSENALPTLLENALTSSNFTVTTEAGKTYFWKVNVTDQNGAKSIGQIWSFTAN